MFLGTTQATKQVAISDKRDEILRMREPYSDKGDWCHHPVFFIVLALFGITITCNIQLKFSRSLTYGFIQIYMAKKWQDFATPPLQATPCIGGCGPLKGAGRRRAFHPLLYPNLEA